VAVQICETENVSSTIQCMVLEILYTNRASESEQILLRKWKTRTWWLCEIFYSIDKSLLHAILNVYGGIISTYIMMLVSNEKALTW